jgi:hypothetical protein
MLGKYVLDGRAGAVDAGGAVDQDGLRQIRERLPGFVELGDV